ncbi:MAG: hypothetical protein AB7G11_10825 [Phycisphaerales bacterium]
MPPDPTNRTQRVLVVVGAHPNAERSDRPSAYALRERIVATLRLDPPAAPDVMVITDVWYLNDESMKHEPVVSVGAPAVNALTAYLASRLPSAFVIDDVLMVQFDPAAPRPVAACWGTTALDTAQACEVFTERYLGEFLSGCLRCD